MQRRHEFGFGLETEYMLVDRDFEPQWIQTLNAERLFDLIDSISNADCSTDGFNQKPLHKRAGHYLIEGYTLTDDQYNAREILPKGIEIRTPKVDSFERCIDDLNLLRARLDERLQSEGLQTAVLSHHPTELELQAPPNYARYDYWQWALTATATYGPDFNISVPDSILNRIDRRRLNGRINYYMPALIGLSVDSPLKNGRLWEAGDKVGKSLRTFRRRLYAPLYYVHDRAGTWFEFKGFEMSRAPEDFCAYFLLSLTLLLDDGLTGEASDEDALNDLGFIAVDGIAGDTVRERIKTVIEHADQLADQLGFASHWLDRLHARVESNTVPADEIIAIFETTGSVPETLKKLNSAATAGSNQRAQASAAGGEIKASPALCR
ncbi:MAG TPA: glutamate-cysteine ligase family protein [Chroococcales cyanobacterium]